MSKPLKFTSDQELFYRHNTLIKSGKYMFVRHMKSKKESGKLTDTEYFIAGNWIPEEAIKLTMEELL
jgi:hypothetical protein